MTVFQSSTLLECTAYCLVKMSHHYCSAFAFNPEYQTCTCGKKGNLIQEDRGFQTTMHILSSCKKIEIGTRLLWSVLNQRLPFYLVWRDPGVSLKGQMSRLLNNHVGFTPRLLYSNTHHSPESFAHLKAGWAQDAWLQLSYENWYFHLDISRRQRLSMSAITRLIGKWIALYHQ